MAGTPRCNSKLFKSLFSSSKGVRCAAAVAELVDGPFSQLNSRGVHGELLLTRPAIGSWRVEWLGLAASTCLSAMGLAIHPISLTETAADILFLCLALDPC